MKSLKFFALLFFVAALITPMVKPSAVKGQGDGAKPANFVDSDRRAAAAIAEALASTPGVTVAELKPALCRTPTECYYREGDNLLYADTHHLTPEGASFALKGFHLPALGGK